MVDFAKNFSIDFSKFSTAIHNEKTGRLFLKRRPAFIIEQL